MGKETVQELTDKQVRFVEEYLVDFNALREAFGLGILRKMEAELGRSYLEKLVLREQLNGE